MALSIQVAEAIARAQVLPRLSPASRARLAGRGAEMSLLPGGHLCAKGDPGDALFVILKREVAVSVATPSGKNVVLASLAGGAVSRGDLRDGPCWMGVVGPPTSPPCAARAW